MTKGRGKGWYGESNSVDLIVEGDSDEPEEGLNGFEHLTYDGEVPWGVFLCNNVEQDVVFHISAMVGCEESYTGDVDDVPGFSILLFLVAIFLIRREHD